MYLQKVISRNFFYISFLLASWRSITKIAGSGSGLVRGMDPRIRIHTKMSWIRNTAISADLGRWRGPSGGPWRGRRHFPRPGPGSHPAQGCCRFLNINPVNTNFVFIVLARVADPHCFNADPDTDPDTAFFLIADQDSGSGFRIRIPDPDPGFDDLKLEKTYSWKFNFYFLDQNRHWWRSV